MGIETVERTYITVLLCLLITTGFVSVGGCAECSDRPSSAFGECNPECIKYNKACLKNDRVRGLECSKTMVHGIDKYICTIGCSSDSECEPGICSEQGYCVGVLDPDWIKL